MGREVFNVNLLGTSFAIQTDQEETYLKELLRFYQDRIEEIEKSGSTKDPLRIAILAGLLTADELFREQKKSGGLNTSAEIEIERITDRIIERIDKSLMEF